MRVDINRGFFVNFFLLLGTLAVLCAITEITSRLAFPEWRYIWSQGFLQHDRVLGTYVGKAGYRSRLYSIYGEFDVPVALNHGGFRNPEGASPEKAGIYCFGDSFGFGWGVKANEVDKNASEVHQKLKNLQSDERKVT